jgi:hypothetical protein
MGAPLTPPECAALAALQDARRPDGSARAVLIPRAAFERLAACEFAKADAQSAPKNGYVYARITPSGAGFDLALHVAEQAELARRETIR